MCSEKHTAKEVFRALGQKNDESGTPDGTFPEFLIDLTYPSGKEPLKTWKVTGRAFCLSHSNRPITFATAGLARMLKA